MTSYLTDGYTPDCRTHAKTEFHGINPVSTYPYKVSAIRCGVAERFDQSRKTSDAAGWPSWTAARTSWFKSLPQGLSSFTEVRLRVTLSFQVTLTPSLYYDLPRLLLFNSTVLSAKNWNYSIIIGSKSEPGGIASLDTLVVKLRYRFTGKATSYRPQCQGLSF